MLPEVNDDLSLWTDYDGTSDIEATTGYYIAVAEVDSDDKCKKVGSTTVIANEEGGGGDDNYVSVVFQVTNENFDSALEVEVTPDDEIMGGLGEETYVQFEMPVGTYTYTASAEGYQTIASQTLTLTNDDLGTTKIVSLTMVASEEQNGEQ